MEIVTTKSGEKENKSNRETLLRDFIRFSWRAARGLTTAAETEGQELVSRLSESGRITQQEGERLLKGLMARMELSRGQFEQTVQGAVRKTVERVHEISNQTVSDLSKQITEAERRVDQLWSRKRGK